MRADFSDPNWAFVAPAYAATLLTLVALVVWTWARLRRWRRAGEREGDGA